MNLFDECRRLGLTYKELARLLGVSATTLHNWRTGRSVVSYSAAERLKDILRAARAGTLDLNSTQWHPMTKRKPTVRRRPAPDLPPLAIPEPPRPMPPPTVLPAPTPSLWQRVGAAVRRVFGKS